MLDRFHDSFGKLARAFGLFQGARRVLNIDERDHGAVDSVVNGAIRSHEYVVPTAVYAQRGALLDAQSPQSFAQHVLQIRQVEGVNLIDGPADIGGNHSQQPLRRGRRAT